MDHSHSKSTRHLPGRILPYTKFSGVPNRAARCLRSDPLPGKIHLEDFTARLNKQCKYRQNCRFPFRDFYRRPLRTPIDLHACNGSQTRLVDHLCHFGYWHNNKQGMADRRRVNGPPSGTRPTVFASSIKSASGAATERPRRQRQPNELRKICEGLQVPFGRHTVVSLLTKLSCQS